ncbi:hypothetical protein GCM10023169_29390 [Georgenia halophila]|uniref:AB hydrolase-1 domain-containing protein n=1 Tax=Georgenia halophila TaxID=620889 RepID=A0ABP8LGA4_9MICO
MSERTLTLDGVDLCFEAYGARADPVVLLIAGGGQSMDWWEVEFCHRLAAVGRHVVRYDHRDTGRSSTSPAGEPSYTAADLARDPLRILDHLAVERAHLVGLSMGGGIAQQLTILHPDRVRTLTLMSTSPAGPGDDDNGLPPMDPQLAATFTDPAPEPDWQDQDAVVTYRVEVERPFGGTMRFDEGRVRRIATREVTRTHNMAASMTNHFLVEDGWSQRSRLSEISVPTLVMHGTADPLLPFGHGVALAREIPGARLVPLDGMGHQQPPPELWDLVIASLAEHTAAG